MKKRLLFSVLLMGYLAQSQEIGLLKYGGGGDWYANPTSLPNLIKFCNLNIGTKLVSKPQTVELSSPDLFSYPFIHATGHGNIVFSDSEVENLRKYLEGGGFIHFDDNYGMSQYLPQQIKKAFPQNPWVELPASHPIFQKPFSFPAGLPKIHEHDGKPPKAFGLFLNNRLALLFTTETDLGDGWENQEVHNNPKEVREKALKMGANIIYHVFNN